MHDDIVLVGVDAKRCCMFGCPIEKFLGGIVARFVDSYAVDHIVW